MTALRPWSADAHERTFERRWFSSSPCGSNDRALLDSPDTAIVHRSRFDWDWGTQYDCAHGSRGWYRTYAGSEPVDVHYDNSTPEEYGVPFHLGETASFRLRLSDGT